jgi:translation elongation factor EF-Tu-like GTPase
MVTGELLNFSHLSDVEKIISKKFKDKKGNETEEKLVMPGDTISIEVKLDKPIVVLDKERFVVREGRSTIAAGRVTQVGEKKNK